MGFVYLAYLEHGPGLPAGLSSSKDKHTLLVQQPSGGRMSQFTVITHKLGHPLYRWGRFYTGCS